MQPTITREEIKNILMGEHCTFPEWVLTDQLYTEIENLILENTKDFDTFPKQSVIRWLNHFEFTDHVSETGFAYYDDDGKLLIGEKYPKDATTRVQKYQTTDDLQKLIRSPFDVYFYDSFTSYSDNSGDARWSFTPLISVPKFSLYWKDYPGYTDLSEEDQLLVQRWNANSEFYDVLRKIQLDDLERIADFLEKDIVQSFWNYEVHVINRISDFASSDQLQVLLEHDSRSEMSVSNRNNDALYRAMKDKNIGLVQAIVQHPNFKYSHCLGYGNYRTNPERDTPCFKLLEDNESREENLELILQKLFPLLTENDRLYAIAECFYWGKYHEDFEFLRKFVDFVKGNDSIACQHTSKSKDFSYVTLIKKC